MCKHKKFISNNFTNWLLQTTIAIKKLFWGQKPEKNEGVSYKNSE